MESCCRSTRRRTVEIHARCANWQKLFQGWELTIATLIIFQWILLNAGINLFNKWAFSTETGFHYPFFMTMLNNFMAFFGATCLIFVFRARQAWPLPHLPNPLASHPTPHIAASPRPPRPCRLRLTTGLRG